MPPALRSLEQYSLDVQRKSAVSSVVDIMWPV